MKHFLAACALAVLVPTAAEAAVYTVDASHLDFHFQNDSNLIQDVYGQFGAAGRMLRVTSLSADLNAAGPVSAEIGDYPTLNVTIPYRLSYTLADSSTGVELTTGHLDINFSLYGIGDRASHKFMVEGGSNPYAPPVTTGTIFEQRTSGFYEQPLWSAERYYHETYGALSWDDNLWDGGDLTFDPDYHNQEHLHIFSVAQAYGGRYIWGTVTGYVHVSGVPEPETYALLTAGLAAVAIARRRWI